NRRTNQVDSPKPGSIFTTVKWQVIVHAASLVSSTLACTASDMNPAKLATLARLDLNASSTVSALTDGGVIFGDGWIDRQTWLPTNEWALTYTVQMPIVRFAWNEIAIRFVPQRS